MILNLYSYSFKVFTCFYALFVMMDLELTFTHQNINNFRKRMALWLLDCDF